MSRWIIGLLMGCSACSADQSRPVLDAGPPYVESWCYGTIDGAAACSAWPGSVIEPSRYDQYDETFIYLYARPPGDLDRAEVRVTRASDSAEVVTTIPRFTFDGGYIVGLTFPMPLCTELTADGTGLNIGITLLGADGGIYPQVPIVTTVQCPAVFPECHDRCTGVPDAGIADSGP